MSFVNKLLQSCGIAAIVVLAGYSGLPVVTPEALAGVATKPALPSTFAIPSNPIVTGSSDLGYLPGSSSVGMDGSYHYTIPIDVAPGGQMQPNLALVYSNRSSNGVLGVGWTLS